MAGTHDAERLEQDAALEKKLDHLITTVEKDRNDLTFLIHEYIPHDHQKRATEAINHLADRARDFLVVQKPNVSETVHHHAPPVAKRDVDQTKNTVFRDGTVLN